MKTSHNLLIARFATIVTWLAQLSATAGPPSRFDTVISGTSATILWEDKSIFEEAGRLIVPDAWAVSDDGRCGCFPLYKITDGPVKKAVYHRFDTILIVNIDSNLVPSIKRSDLAFTRANLDWFEVDRVLAVSGDGNQALINFRQTDGDIKIWCTVGLVDFTQKTITTGTALAHRLFDSTPNVKQAIK